MYILIFPIVESIQHTILYILGKLALYLIDKGLHLELFPEIVGPEVSFCGTGFVFAYFAAVRLTVKAYQIVFCASSCTWDVGEIFGKRKKRKTQAEKECFF